MPRTSRLLALCLAPLLVFGLVAATSVSQQPVSSAPSAQHGLVASYVAHPRHWMIVREGSPFTVPAGKTFVPTAVGGVFSSPGTVYSSNLILNGNTEFSAQLAPGSSLVSTPMGLLASSGQVVEADTSSSSVSGRAWGYLVPSDGSHYDRLIVPGPLSWVKIDEAAPYVVPVGKHLVLNAAGTTSTPYSELRVNGVLEHASSNQQFNTSESSPVLPIGLKAGPGDIIEVTGQFSPGRAYGYLVNL